MKRFFASRDMALPPGRARSRRSPFFFSIAPAIRALRARHAIARHQTARDEFPKRLFGFGSEPARRRCDVGQKRGAPVL